MLSLRPNTFDLLYSGLLEGTDMFAERKNSSLSSYSLTKEKDQVVFKTLASGLSESDITMSIDNKKLLVKGNSETKEQFISNFSFKIPVGDVQAKNTKAELSKGILTIKMPLKEDKKSFDIKF